MLPDDLLELFSCAVLEPELRAVLLFDFPSDAFEEAVEYVEGLLRQHIRKQVRQVVLGAAETEDDVWGFRRDWEGKLGKLSALLPRGTLGEPLRSGAFPLVIVPDLANLSLSASRAGVACLETPLISLQRHGESRTFATEGFWLARCACEDLGDVSPHLLDRLPLRYAGARFTTGNRVARLQTRLKSPEGAASASLPVLDRLIRKLAAAKERKPTVHSSAIEHVLEVFAPAQGPFGMRRPITLLRLARAFARLQGQSEVLAEQVTLAARLLGLKPLLTEPHDVPRESRPSLPSPHDAVRVPPLHPLIATPDLPRETAAAAQEPEPSQEVETSVFASTSTAGRIGHKANPFPEDQTTPEPESSTLRLPVTRSNRGTARGIIIGVQPARGIQDIAICATVLEAAKFQGARRSRRARGNRGLVFAASDLRSYRRLPLTERMLVLVLDYTSFSGCDWRQALLPFLIEAYTDRANVCIIQVGAKSAPNELQASKLSARSLLVPKIGAALNESAGRATPLAHGLELAQQSVRRALLRGRSRMAEASVVVFTDGRANVPLAWSHAGRIEARDGPAQGRSFDDCKRLGRELARIRGVHATVLVVNATPLNRLPTELGWALQATIQTIPADGEQEAPAL